MEENGLNAPLWGCMVIKVNLPGLITRSRTGQWQRERRKGLAERYSGKGWLDFGEDCMGGAGEGRVHTRMSSKSLSILV